MRVFKEEQRFTQTWLLVLIAIGLIVPIGILSKDLGKEDTNLNYSEFTIILILLLFFSSIIFVFKLKTRIDERGVHYQFFPFHLKYKTLLWTEIQSISVRKYDPIGEYGGWGIKGYNRKNGTAVNVAGNIGIQLLLTTGKKLLIGTQKEADVKRIIAYYQSKSNFNENY